eukprot:TRINITY_DN4631_c0_g1_i1.p1 TRINITY_DN4631_c0_g1~~TRINITY_DN4631_c0_g1_i1.p1  ORF type:complete len:1117 (+),score=319.96 TRINITY_DN4631_c0_g1_i1:65-3352(+)
MAADTESAPSGGGAPPAAAAAAEAAAAEAASRAAAAAAADPLRHLSAKRYEERAAAVAGLFERCFAAEALQGCVHDATGGAVSAADWAAAAALPPHASLPEPTRWPVALARVVVHRELTPYLIDSACPNCVAKVLRGSSSVPVDWVGDAATLLLFRAVADDDDEQRAESVAALIVARLGDVDAEVLFRNAAGRRSASAQQASRVVAQRLWRARKQRGIAAVPYEPPRMSLRARLAYVEPHERNAELRKFLLLSHSLGAISLLGEEDIRIVGLMVQHYGSGGSSGECVKDSPEEDIFLALRACTNWLLAVLQPFSARDPDVRTAVDPDALEVLLGALVHLTKRPRQHTGREELLLGDTLYLFNVLCGHRGLRREAALAIDLVALARVAHGCAAVRDAAWELFAHISQEGELARALCDPDSRVLATVAAALRAEAEYGKVLTAHAAAAGAHIAAHGPVYCQEMLQSMALCEGLSACLGAISPAAHSHMLVANVAALLSRLIAHMPLPLAKAAHSAMARLVQEAAAVDKSAPPRRRTGELRRAQGSLCLGLAVGMDSRVDNIDRARDAAALRDRWAATAEPCLVALCEVVPLWGACDAALAALGLLTASAGQITTAVAEAAAERGLLQLYCGSYLSPPPAAPGRPAPPVTALPLVCRLVAAVVGSLREASPAWWRAAEDCVPPLLDAAAAALSAPPPPPASGRRDTLLCCCEALAAFAASHGGEPYPALFLWRACGRATALSAPELLLDEGGEWRPPQGLSAGRRAAVAPIALQLMADCCALLPSAAAEVAARAEAVAGACAAVTRSSAGAAGECHGLRLLAALAMYERSTAQQLLTDPELCAAVARARAQPLGPGASALERLTAASAHALAANIAAWQSRCADGALLRNPAVAPQVDRSAVEGNVAVLAAAADREERAAQRFEREFAPAFAESRREQQRRRAERSAQQPQEELRRRAHAARPPDGLAGARDRCGDAGAEWRRLRDAAEGCPPPSPQFRAVCGFCARRREGAHAPFRACTGCHCVAYCSEECQRMHWSSRTARAPHKGECARLRRERADRRRRRRRRAASEWLQLGLLCLLVCWVLCSVFGDSSAWGD